MLLEVGNCVVGDGAFAPVTDVVSEDAGLFKVVDGGSDNGGVGDGLCAVSGKVLTDLDLCPKVGKGLIGVPLATEVF